MSRKRSRIDNWLETTYAECLGELRKFLFRIVRSEQVAEDLAHDAFLNVYTASKFDQGRPSNGYLFTTARNLAINNKKRHCVTHTEPMDEVAAVLDERASVEQEAMTAEKFEVLGKAMDRLTERQNEVLTLYAFLGFTYQEAADKLNVSNATVHREMARVLEVLHEVRSQAAAEKACLDGGVTVRERGREQGT